MINWKPIEELKYKSGEIIFYQQKDHKYALGSFEDKDVERNLIILHGFRGFTLSKIKQKYTHYQLLTPPEE